MMIDFTDEAECPLFINPELVECLEVCADGPDNKCKIYLVLGGKRYFVGAADTDVLAEPMANAVLEKLANPPA